MIPMKKDQSTPTSKRVLRPTSIRELKDNAKTSIGEKSFCVNAAKIWNNTTSEIKNAKTLNEAKRLIKIYSRTMPI